MKLPDPYAPLNRDQLVANIRGKAWRLNSVLMFLIDLEEELREQATGSQDGYLLDVANRIRTELNSNQPNDDRPESQRELEHDLPNGE